jgi:hypothetical protein
MKYLLWISALVLTPAGAQDFKPTDAKAAQIIQKIVDYTPREYLPWDSTRTYKVFDQITYNGKTYFSTSSATSIGIRPDENDWAWTEGECLLFMNVAMESIDWWSINNKINKEFTGKRDAKGRILSPYVVIFLNCQFNSFSLANISLRGLLFQQCRIQRLSVWNLGSKYLKLEEGGYNDIEATNSDIGLFHGGLWVNYEPHITESQPPGMFLADSRIERLQIISPPDGFRLRIEATSISGDGEQPEALFFGTFPQDPSTYSFDSKNSNFGTPGDSTMMKFRGTFSNVLLDSCEVHANLILHSSNITNRLHFTSNYFSGLLALNNCLLPMDVRIRWSQIRGERLAKFERLELLDRLTGTFRQVERLYSAGPGSVSNLNHFEDIMKSYQSLFNIYRAAGDLESANGCYAEMKDIQTQRLEFLYGEKTSFQTYTRWKLSQLMKFYTEHGTDPAKAIQISVWVIVLFGVFYFFFPSDWDVTSKGKLISNFRDFIQKNDKGYYKPFLFLMLQLLISMLNAITLSLNSFTTLGFGNIPTHGLARYVTIIEGFIGWFLLSIFTVALINQVLS